MQTITHVKIHHCVYCLCMHLSHFIYRQCPKQQCYWIFFSLVLFWTAAQPWRKVWVMPFSSVPQLKCGELILSEETANAIANYSCILIVSQCWKQLKSLSVSYEVHLVYSLYCWKLTPTWILADWQKSLLWVFKWLMRPILEPQTVSQYGYWSEVLEVGCGRTFLVRTLSILCCCLLTNPVEIIFMECGSFM